MDERLKMLFCIQYRTTQKMILENEVFALQQEELPYNDDDDDQNLGTVPPVFKVGSYVTTLPRVRKIFIGNRNIPHEIKKYFSVTGPNSEGDYIFTDRARVGQIVAIDEYSSTRAVRNITMDPMPFRNLYVDIDLHNLRGRRVNDYPESGSIGVIGGNRFYLIQLFQTKEEEMDGSTTSIFYDEHYLVKSTDAEKVTHAIQKMGVRNRKGILSKGWKTHNGTMVKGLPDDLNPGIEEFIHKTPKKHLKRSQSKVKSGALHSARRSAARHRKTKKVVSKRSASKMDRYKRTEQTL